MRRISTLGMVIVSMTAAMACAGTSSAMAEDTALCLIHQTPCSPGNQVKRVHWVSTGSEFLSSIVNVSCTRLLVWEVLALGNPQLAHVIESILSSCKTSTGTACTVTTISLPLADILKLALNLADVTFLGGEVKYVCGALLSCTYGNTGVVLHLLGSTGGAETTKQVGSKVKLTKTSGILCPSEAFLDVDYTALEDFYVTS